MADTAADTHRCLDEWRGQGADRCDPVRFRFIEALATRAQGYQGATRARLDARLAAALQDFRQRLAIFTAFSSEAGAAPVDTVVATLPDGGVPSSPLAELAERINNAHSSGETAAMEVSQDSLLQPLSSRPSIKAPAGELKALRYFRESWAKLSLEQQLAEALAQTPDNAGPLNSQLLVLRALQRMRDLSPAYLARFMAHADALLWLERTAHQTASPAPSSVASSASRQKKNPR